MKKKKPDKTKVVKPRKTKQKKQENDRKNAIPKERDEGGRSKSERERKKPAAKETTAQKRVTRTVLRREESRGKRGEPKEVRKVEQRCINGGEKGERKI